MKTLEELLKMKVKTENFKGEEVEITPDFRIAVQSTHVDGTHIIVHPLNHNGDTLDFVVKDNTLYPVNNTLIEDLVNRFLSWPLPESVASDLCVVSPSKHSRCGTNLLTANEAKEMLMYVLSRS